jgi:hypothetical protein
MRALEPGWQLSDTEYATHLPERTDEKVGHVLLDFDAEARLLDEHRRLEVGKWHRQSVRACAIARDHVDLRSRARCQRQERLLELGSGVHLWSRWLGLRAAASAAYWIRLWTEGGQCRGGPACR